MFLMTTFENEHNSEMCLEPCQTPILRILRENSYLFKAVNYFCEMFHQRCFKWS